MVYTHRTDIASKLALNIVAVIIQLNEKTISEMAR